MAKKKIKSSKTTERKDLTTTRIRRMQTREKKSVEAVVPRLRLYPYPRDEKFRSVSLPFKVSVRNRTEKGLKSKINDKVKSRLFFFNKIDLSPVCVARRLRREFMFASGLAGKIKVRFAKWTKDSKVRC